MEEIVEKEFLSKVWKNAMKMNSEIIDIKVFDFKDRESVLLYTLSSYEDIFLISTCIFNEKISEADILESIKSEIFALSKFEFTYPATYLKNYYNSLLLFHTGEYVESPIAHEHISNLQEEGLSFRDIIVFLNEGIAK